MSTSWREAILDEFVPQLARLTLVADPDGLLAEEGMQASLQEQGFEVVEFQDPIAFRYLYETTYRPRWNAGEQVELAVVLRSDRSGLHRLPFDILSAGRQLFFGLSDLFPKLTYNEVAALDHEDLDPLYRAYPRLGPGNLGENATRDFILRHVFDISADLIKGEAGLLSLLLRLHSSGRQLPSPFVDRLVQQLSGTNGFASWPLHELLSDPAALLEFLQERWPYYLDKEAVQKGKPVYEAAAESAYTLKWPGPQLLPFGRSDIRAFVDTLFLEGKLRPVAHASSHRFKDLWVAVGLRQDSAADSQQRLARLLGQLKDRVPPMTAHHHDWLSFAPAWAEAIVRQHALSTELDPEVQSQFAALQATVDAAFQEWLGHRYRYLPTLPPHPPVMVHHIARSLARQVNPHSNTKVALVVVDGLALDQWLIMRDGLKEQLPGIRFRESAAFAWIPTVTSVSRQAIFSAKMPLYFPTSITTTAKEPNLWSVFWEDQGLSPTSIGYERKLRSAADLDRVDQLLTRPNMRVVGLVVDQIDHMMHGITLGLRGLHQQLRLWLSNRFLARLIERLWQDGYLVHLTSDHGNTVGQGMGWPREGSLADVKGQRVRIFPNETLRKSIQESFPDAIPWPTEALPPDFYPLLAPDRRAFVAEGEETVSHGGSLLEEVVVPYVIIERRNV